MLNELMFPPYRKQRKPASSTGVFLACLLPAMLLVVLLVPPVVASANGPDIPAGSAPSQTFSYTPSDLQTSGFLASPQAPIQTTKCWVLAYDRPDQWSWMSQSDAFQGAEVVNVGSDELVLLCQ